MTNQLRYAHPLRISTPSKGKNPALVYLAGLAPTGRRGMRGRLQTVADMFEGTVEDLPWHEIRYQHVEAIRSKLLESELAPSTVNATLYAIRGVARAAFNLELMPADAYERIRNIRPAKGNRLPPGRALSVGEIGAMLDTCTNGVIGARDAALISLMYAAGLRRAEIAALSLEDFNDGELKVKGKGNRERLLYVDNGALYALMDWISVRGEHPGPLFNPITKGGEIQTRKMTEQAIYNLLSKRAKEAGIGRFSPHDLRRSFISELLDRGADLSTVQQLAGHANVQTTAKYDRRGERAKKKAIGLLHVPYKRGLKRA